MRSADQSEPVAAAIDGRDPFLARAEMERLIVADEREHVGHFDDSRHRMQIDVDTAVRDLHAGLERGMARAEAATGGDALSRRRARTGTG